MLRTFFDGGVHACVCVFEGMSVCVCVVYMHA